MKLTKELKDLLLAKGHEFEIHGVRCIITESLAIKIDEGEVEVIDKPHERILELMRGSVTVDQLANIVTLARSLGLDELPIKVGDARELLHKLTFNK